MPLTREQSNHLNSRINERMSQVRYYETPEPPAAVKKARALVDAWVLDTNNKTADRVKRAEAARTATQEAVLSGDWPTALAAVKKFETTKF